MKVLTIPDLHGKDCWKQKDFSAYDKVVFLGDYVDSKSTVPDLLEIQNLLEIIRLKKEFPDKIELLLGNHDIQYLYFPKYKTSSINWGTQRAFTEIFETNREFFKVAFQVGHHIWSHAGVSTGWLNHYCQQIEGFGGIDYHTNLADFLNKMLEDNLHVLATISGTRGGTSYYGGVFWADMSELSSDYLKGVHQYVGHTKVPVPIKVGDKNGSINFLDCLDMEIKFISISL